MLSRVVTGSLRVCQNALRNAKINQERFKNAVIVNPHNFSYRNLYLFSKQKQPFRPQRDPNLDAQMRPADEQSQGQPRPTGQRGVGEDNKGMQTSQFGKSVLIGSVIALALAYAYMQIQIIRANKKNTKENTVAKVVGVGKAHIGGDWQLTDTDGNLFGSQQLKGSYYLIYFGFTHCPDICPNSLTKLSRAVAAIKKNPKSSFFDLKTVFVSVDPDRDSLQKIKKFITIFDPQMIGVTAKHNNDQVLRQCMRKFKIYASRLQYDQQGEDKKDIKAYTIDHTILTYLMSDTNQYIVHLGGSLGEHDLTRIIMEKISQDKAEKMRRMKI